MGVVDMASRDRSRVHSERGGRVMGKGWDCAEGDAESGWGEWVNLGAGQDLPTHDEGIAVAGSDARYTVI